METNFIDYSFEKSLSRIDEILDASSDKYEERNTVVFCGSVHLFPIEVYKRIPKEMTRVHIFYADGSNRTIDTGAVSIQ